MRERERGGGGGEKFKNYNTVVFASNDKYAPHLATAIYSLLVNNKKFKFKIIILHSNISKKNKNIIFKITKKFNTLNNFIYIDDNIFKNIKINSSYLSIETLFRIIAGEIISDDKCLYLDCDLIVDGSIGNIFDININKYFLAAAEDQDSCVIDDVFKKKIGISKTSKYFNAGVILMNLSMFRKYKLANSVVKWLKNNYSNDQDALNFFCENRWKVIDAKYNVQIKPEMKFLNFFNSRYGSRALIYHFTGAPKPWDIVNNSPFRQIYWRYRNQTDYSSILQFEIKYSSFKKYVYLSFIKLIPVTIKSFIKKIYFR
jgi:lipopolysaccharide biosynthesis glycosyltransferase